MPTAADQFRLLHRLDLAPSLISLGLEPALFRDGGDADATSFDAAMSGPGDTLWLFRGEDFLGYDLRSDTISHPQRPIATGWVGGALPPAFAVGIDAAVWGGPGFPDTAYLCRAGEFLRLDCSPNPGDPATWRITLDPVSIADEWLRAPSPDGVPRRGATLEPSTKLYGLREAANRVHFFTRDGRYARHNFENGEYDIAPSATIDHWALPDHFAGRVDLAFYGAGELAEHIFFFCRQDYAQFDIRRGQVVRTGAIEQRFPALGALLARPQLYLVEDYAIDTHVGPLTLGRLVSTLQMPPQSVRTSTVVTRVVSPATLALRQNLLEQDSAGAIGDFYARLASGPPGAPVGNLIWDGEIDALAGGDRLDGRRDALAETVFAAIAEQARQSSHVVEQQLLDAGAALPVGAGEVVNTETFELRNDGTTTRQIEFMELLQRFLTLLVLRNVRLAYGNGRDRPEVFALREVDLRLADLLVDPADAGPIIAFLREQLARIGDSTGDMRSILVAGSSLDVDARVQSVFVVDDVVPAQTIPTTGIVRAARDWHQPTYQTRPFDISQAGADGSADITRTALAPSGDVAAIVQETADATVPAPQLVQDGR